MSSYIDHVMEMLEPLGGISQRAMFSGYGIYKDGIIFAVVADDILYFKVGDNNRGDYEREGCQPLRYKSKGKTVSLSYWEVPLMVMEDSGLLRAWVDKACKAALSSAVKKKKSQLKLVKK